MTQMLSSAFAAMSGMLMLLCCFFFLHHLMTKRWRWFSDRLGREMLTKARAEHVTGLIVISDVPNRQMWATGYHKHPPVVFGIHPDGLSVRIRWPFGLFTVPFVLPIKGLKVERTSWPDLAGDFVAISHEIVPDAYIIAYDEVIDWAHAHNPRIPHPGPRADAGKLARRFGAAQPVHSKAD